MSQPHSAPAERLPEGSLLAGRYEVVAVLGSGGMATVYKARDAFLNREVAVKVMAPWLADDDAYNRRFGEEARAAAGLSHPNIVTIYDTLEEEGRRFIVMELVDGRSLDELMPLEQDAALDVARKLASALDYAHSMGIVHCDIKPQNVLVDASGRPKLLDFGIARATTQTWAMATTVLGTAAYMAPEAVEGRRPDARSDVYSLATLLYEMLAGRLPYEADSAAAVTAQRLVADPVPLSKYVSVPKPLEQAVMTALARDPDKRPQTAAAFAATLAPAEESTPALDLTAAAAAAADEPKSGDQIEHPVEEPFATSQAAAAATSEALDSKAALTSARKSRSGLMWAMGGAVVVAIFAGAFFAASSLFSSDDEPDYEAYFQELEGAFASFRTVQDQQSQQFSGQQGSNSEENKQLYVQFLRSYVETRSQFIGTLERIDPPEELQDEHQAFLEAATGVVFALDEFATLVQETEPNLVRTLDISAFEQADENQVRACNALQDAAAEQGFDVNLECLSAEGAVQAPPFGEGSPPAAEDQAPTGDGGEDEGEGEGQGNGRGQGRGNGNGNGNNDDD
ncbi:MAG TPA: serine/threonine-protein kinase [Dehalococcoidia bacterium]|nr:serine/threonine-protein kinase [Dehalococcoidia bacterium]